MNRYIKYTHNELIKPYYFFRYYLRRRFISPPPNLIIYADPNSVAHYLGDNKLTDGKRKMTGEMDRGQFTRRKNVGKCIPGNWDRKRGNFSNLKIYKSLNRAFVENADWHETSFYNHCIESINSGDKVYGCTSKKEFEQNRLRYLEELYIDMKRNGYRRQGHRPSDSRDRGGGFEGILHEVNINIDREGDIIFNNTTRYNRLSLAKILNIDSIPMTVIVRHKKWQNFRQDISSADSISQLHGKQKNIRSSRHKTSP